MKLNLKLDLKFGKGKKENAEPAIQKPAKMKLSVGALTGVFKKYTALLVPVGIVLASVIFIVLAILSTKSLAKEIQSGSLTPGNQVISLIQKAPSESSTENMKKYQDAHQIEADKVAELAKQSTMRELIKYNIFPEPEDESAQLFDEFGEMYRIAIENFVNKMKALDAPTDMEINDAAGRQIQNVAGRSTVARGAAGEYGLGGGRRSLEGRGEILTRGQTMYNAGAGNQSRDQELLDYVCKVRAQEISVYANPKIFKWYDFWKEYQYPGSELALEDCWYSQISYWIYEDVVGTIRELNSSSDSVFTSPVKRLIGVSFESLAGSEALSGQSRSASLGSTGRTNTMRYSSPTRSRSNVYTSSSTAEKDQPVYITDITTNVLGVDPWTQRVCNEDIDVVHFSVSIVVASKSVMSFMKELCSEKMHKFRTDYSLEGQEVTFKHNQITILQSQVSPVIRDDGFHYKYRYGDNAVVQLDLVCEYIFNRNGYDEIKPETIKELLGQTASAAAKPGAITPGAMRSRRPVRNP